MKKSRFSEEQIIYVLKQLEIGVPIGELGRKYGVSQQTIYRWRKQYGGLTASELRRLKELEQENRRLKQLVADLALDKQILQDVLGKKDEAGREARAREQDPGWLPDLRTTSL